MRCKYSSRVLTVLATVLLVLGGCQTVPTQTDSGIGDSAAARADALARQGRHDAAAEDYLELAETSATLDVGFDRQQMALSLQVEPERPILPEIFGIQPLSTITGSGFVDGDGQYGFELGGVWHSTVPEADINGSLRVETGAVGLEGSVTEGNTTLVASLELFNNQTVGRVSFPESYSQDITGIVDKALDRKLDDVQQAVSALEEAIADYPAQQRGVLRNRLWAIGRAVGYEWARVTDDRVITGADLREYGLRLQLADDLPARLTELEADVCELLGPDAIEGNYMHADNCNVQAANR